MELSFTFTEEKVTGTSVGDQKIKVEGRDNVLIRELGVAPSLAPRTMSLNCYSTLSIILVVFLLSNAIVMSLGILIVK
ncbi:hypothetical protein LMG33810_001674 [Carnimonas sp. LMG 33810]